MIGASLDPIRIAFREKYACGKSSPKNVIPTVEAQNAISPLPGRTRSMSIARTTLTPTFPHKIVERRKFASFLRARILAADMLPFSTSVSSLSLPIEKKAKFKPENIADWLRQNAIAIIVRG